MPKFKEDVLVEGIIRARDGFASSTDDWALVRNGEHLEIQEPKQGHKVWVRFNDDQGCISSGPRTCA